MANRPILMAYDVMRYHDVAMEVDEPSLKQRSQ